MTQAADPAESTPSVIVRCGAPDGKGRRCNRIVRRISTTFMPLDGSILTECKKHDQPRGTVADRIRARAACGMTILRTVDVHLLAKHYERATAEHRDVSVYAR